MKEFLDQNFLLSTGVSQQLYHTYAAGLPILDYHCHIDPRELWEDRRYENLTQLWLGSDHYKWRLMRSNGVEERYITGDAGDWEKFLKFAQTLPRAVGNPIYHWCHMELRTYFGYQGLLNEKTAGQVWELCRARLREDPNLSARGILLSSRVAMLGTTDDPCSDLCWHKKLALDAEFPVKVYPTFRPDPAVELSRPDFPRYLERLEQAAGLEIRGLEDLKEALSLRMDWFAGCGCRGADHGLFRLVYRPVDDGTADRALQKARLGQPVGVEEAEGYQTALLLHCAREYARRGWVMQLHFGCIRNPNRRMLEQLGPDAGFDGIGATDNCQAAYGFLDRLEQEGRVPRMILYSLNPGDNAWIDVLLGAFQSAECPGKLQHGSAWWFNDHYAGIREHLTSLANLSVLGNFIGMLTDSRSLLSYVRHGYFRRILCGLLGEWVEQGKYPEDMETLGALVQDICFRNARRYFNL